MLLIEIAILILVYLLYILTTLIRLQDTNQNILH